MEGVLAAGLAVLDPLPELGGMTLVGAATSQPHRDHHQLGDRTGRGMRNHDSWSTYDSGRMGLTSMACRDNLDFRSHTKDPRPVNGT
jgi:hypothetical protein